MDGLGLGVDLLGAVGGGGGLGGAVGGGPPAQQAAIPGLGGGVVPGLRGVGAEREQQREHLSTEGGRGVKRPWGDERDGQQGRTATPPLQRDLGVPHASAAPLQGVTEVVLQQQQPYEGFRDHGYGRGRQGGGGGCLHPPLCSPIIIGRGNMGI